MVEVLADLVQDAYDLGTHRSPGAKRALNDDRDNAKAAILDAMADRDRQLTALRAEVARGREALQVCVSTLADPAYSVLCPPDTNINCQRAREHGLEALRAAEGA